MSKISEPPFEVVYDFSNLYRAYRMARKGKRWKNPVAKVEANVLEAVRYIQMELETGTYCPGGYFEFIVHEPKERIVQTNSFKDKIVQQVQDVPEAEGVRGQVQIRGDDPEGNRGQLQELAGPRFAWELPGPDPRI